MRIGLLIPSALLACSCSRQPEAFVDFARHPLSIEKKKITSSPPDFQLSIPADWIWKVESYADKTVHMGLMASAPPDKMGNISLLSIEKRSGLSGQTELKTEFESVLRLFKQNRNSWIIRETGTTTLGKRKAYFVHVGSKSPLPGSPEMMVLVAEGKRSGTFYHLNGSVPQSEDFTANMATVVQCMETFEVIESK